MNVLSIPDPQPRTSTSERWLHWRSAASVAFCLLLGNIVPASAQTWESVSPSLAGSATGVVCDSSGAVYVCGQARLGVGDYRAVILKNDNLGGVNDWTTSFISDP